MKKLISISIATLSLASVSQAYSADAVINGTGRYGCVSEEYYDKTTEMVVQNDREAFNKLLSTGISSRMCTMFNNRESVVISKNGILKIKLRRRGDLTEYWTVRESITY